jgi:DNA-directed RNA polymerase subunit omega
MEVGSNMAKKEEEDLNIADEESNQQEMDSKYRLIIVAAKRSKQLQRGAQPRIEIDTQKHKFTRIALEEVQQGKVNFEIIGED